MAAFSAWHSSPGLRAPDNVRVNKRKTKQGYYPCNPHHTSEKLLSWKITFNLLTSLGSVWKYYSNSDNKQ